MIDYSVLESRLVAIEARLDAVEVGAVDDAYVSATDPWFDTCHAAAHLGITPKALRKIAGERRKVPFEQEGPGCKMWFRRSALDAYRRGEMQR